MIAWLAAGTWLLSVAATAYGVQFFYRLRLDTMAAELAKTRKRLHVAERQCALWQSRQSAIAEQRHALHRMQSAPTRHGA